jgi:hypothetical protein
MTLRSSNQLLLPYHLQWDEYRHLPHKTHALTLILPKKSRIYLALCLSMRSMLLRLGVTNLGFGLHNKAQYMHL